MKSAIWAWAAAAFRRVRDVDIGEAVAVGEAEAVVVLYVVGDTLESAASECGLAGIDERHLPRLGLPFVHGHRVVGHVECHVRHVQKIVREILLDHVALVAAADHEVVDAVRGVELHDVPEDRPAADLHHRLGLEVGFLGESRAKSAGEDDSFHRTVIMQGYKIRIKTGRRRRTEGEHGGLTTA